MAAGNLAVEPGKRVSLPPMAIVAAIVVLAGLGGFWYLDHASRQSPPGPAPPTTAARAYAKYLRFVAAALRPGYELRKRQRVPPTQREILNVVGTDGGGESVAGGLQNLSRGGNLNDLRGGADAQLHLDVCGMRGGDDDGVEDFIIEAFRGPCQFIGARLQRGEDVLAGCIGRDDLAEASRCQRNRESGSGNDGAG